MGLSEVQDEVDKRAFNLYITEKTQRLMPKFRKISRGWTDILLCNFTGEEMDHAFEMLNRMVENTQMHLKGKEQE